MMQALQLPLAGPVALRALARAFSQFGEFDNFVRGLESALAHSDRFERLTIQLDRAVATDVTPFPAGALSVPLGSSAGSLGSLQVVAGDRPFGAEDLHLIAGLADFLSATIAQALNVEDAAKRRELLRFLLNQAPVGIAAYGDNKRLIVANDLASRWLGEAKVPFEDLQKATGGFHLRASGKLIVGEARRMPEDTAGTWIVVLQDLTGEQARLLELVQRETYRALVENSRVGFAFVEGPAGTEGVLRRLRDLRGALLPGEMAGPYDSRRVGFVLPGVDGVGLRTRLRRLRPLFGDTAGLKLGYAELGRDGRTPEALLQAALRCDRTFEEQLRPVMLVHDDSAAVVDMFALVLGKEFEVVKSTSPTRTRELLATGTFEAFVTELELRNGVSGLDLIRLAREKQPGVRPFITTVQRAPYGLPPGWSDAEAQILEKPFDVEALTRTVRAKLAEPELAK